MSFRIANAAGFLGDSIAAPRQLVESARVDVLTLEYLAELTLSILARQREKNRQLGYAGDFLTVLESLTPALSQQKQLKIVTNAGGMNPAACAAAAAYILSAEGLGHLRIGIVTGDDLLPRIENLLQTKSALSHFESGAPLAAPLDAIACANAYLGAKQIVESLQSDARIVITGRVADASLTLGPALYKYGWQWDDYNRLAAASVAGHLIECGAQVTGGYSTSWNQYDLTEIGYPIAEIEEDGSCTITKPDGSGGSVNRQTVIQQLVYEIGDPGCYLTPDVEVDFTTVEVQQCGENRVWVHGVTGRKPPQTLKVSLAYRDGFTASGQLLVYGPDCLAKARTCGELIRQRLKNAALAPEQIHIEILGSGDGVPGCAALKGAAPQSDLPEVVLRMAVYDRQREPVKRFTKEIAPLITNGPAGLAGYAVARSPIRSVFAFWPTTIQRSAIQPQVEVHSAKDWLAR